MKNSLFRRTIIHTALPEGEPDGGVAGDPDEPDGTDKTPPEGDDPDAGEDEDPDEDEFDSAKALSKIRKLNSENRALRKREKDAREKADGADEATQKATALEAQVLRLSVALKHGLPERIASRLQGETEEELLSDAQELLESFSPKAPASGRPKVALRGGSDPTQEPEETDLDKLGARMFRR